MWKSIITFRSEKQSSYFRIDKVCVNDVEQQIETFKLDSGQFQNQTISLYGKDVVVSFYTKDVESIAFIKES
ncbi:hypothetical protein HCB21_02885 [Listeria booriae]|uniref:hypothetical protein n=1 Tax=Listeria booriae TaxID=1552123 RepID=UPI0016273B49|nr:hypothetical protein [Listeria booriae]MBC1209512.1 hypothetical protein [Listeria booriae]MBC2158700.1 hypothetical protein [Listeria booriae]